MSGNGNGGQKYIAGIVTGISVILALIGTVRYSVQAETAVIREKLSVIETTILDKEERIRNLERSPCKK